MNAQDACTLAALMAQVQTALRHAGIGPRDRVVVGVSGGCDSMALAHVLHALDQPMVVAHVHHGTRGHESDEDWAFVKAWAEQRNRPVEVLHLDSDALRGERQGFQGEARKARYAWFSRLQTAHGARATLTAHHADDHVETALLNVLRGLDPLGLRGMMSGGESAVRPFLTVWRSEVEAVARAEGWVWREDSSNRSSAYLRNRLRHELLPLLEDLTPGVKAHLQHLSHETAHLEGVLRPLVAEARKRATGDGHRWDVEVLRNEPLAQEALVTHLLALGWSRTHARRAVALVDAQAGKRVVAPLPRSGQAKVVRERHHLVVNAHEAAPSSPETPVVLSWENAPAQGEIAGMCWRSPSDPWPPEQRTPECVWVPEAWFPVIWRPWRHGDRIQPVGMEGHAKVSDVLTQGKVPHLQRPFVRVLERSSDGQVVWVSGLKVSEDLRAATAAARSSGAASTTESSFPEGPAAADRTIGRGMRLRVCDSVRTSLADSGQPDQAHQADQTDPR